MDRAAFDLGENGGCTIKKNRLVERYRRCIYCKRGMSEESLIYYSFLSHYGEFRDTCARTITRKYVHTNGMVHISMGHVDVVHPARKPDL